MGNDKDAMTVSLPGVPLEPVAAGIAFVGIASVFMELEGTFIGKTLVFVVERDVSVIAEVVSVWFANLAVDEELVGI